VREVCGPRAAGSLAGFDRLAGLAARVVSTSISSDGGQSSGTNNAASGRELEVLGAWRINADTDAADI
jgi:hypothetical protein